MHPVLHGLLGGESKASKLQTVCFFSQILRVCFVVAAAVAQPFMAQVLLAVCKRLILACSHDVMICIII